MVYTYTGKNSAEMSSALDKKIKAFEARNGAFAIERIDASEQDVDTILQAVQSVPFLVPEKLLIIKNISANNQLLDRIAEIVDRAEDSVEVLFVDYSLDKRKASYKVLQKVTKVIDFPELSFRELPKWVIEEAKQVGATISTSDAQFLLERVGSNQLQLRSEIEKLALYNPAIQRETIELLTDQSAQATIFELLDAAFTGKSAIAIEKYREQRRARVDPHYIVAMLAWQLHAIALAVFSETKQESELVSAGLSPFSARKALQSAKLVTKKQVKQMIVDMAALDAAIKSTSDADTAIELYLLSMK